MCKKPCSECPFRKKSLPGYVGGHKDIYEIYEYAQYDVKFPCHMSVTKVQKEMALQHEQDDDLDVNHINAEVIEKAMHCTGSLIFMNNIIKSSRDPKTRELQKQLGKSSEVFQSAHEFLRYHKTKDPNGLELIRMMDEHFKKLTEKRGDRGQTCNSVHTCTTGRHQVKSQNRRKKTTPQGRTRSSKSVRR